MNISFAWTSPALLARRKTVTRRDWDEAYGRRFQAGQLVDAYDRSPRFHGQQIGTIRLTVKPYQESEDLMPESDYEGEGFAFLEERPDLKPAKWRVTDLRELFEQCRRIGETVWVVRFELVTVTPFGRSLIEKWKLPVLEDAQSWEGLR